MQVNFCTVLLQQGLAQLLKLLPDAGPVGGFCSLSGGSACRHRTALQQPPDGVDKAGSSATGASSPLLPRANKRTGRRHVKGGHR